MGLIEEIGRNIAKGIDQAVRSRGHEPSEFYRKYNLTNKIWRIKAGKSFSYQGVMQIITLAEKDLHNE